MARCAGAALLGAIEIYNKPTVEYREQTFAMLITNAWEILLKARIVQLRGGRLQAIYRRKRGTRLIDREPETDEPRTISLRQALQKTPVPSEVAANITGLMFIRNHAAHLGTLEPAAQQQVLQFGTAGVQNFLKLSRQWFGETIVAPYLLPLGFVGDATILQTSVSQSQRSLLKALNTISSSSASADNSDYSVILRVDVQLNRGLSGGGSIGMTNNPAAPKVTISDDEALKYYAVTYQDIASACRTRYPGFKQNAQFVDAIKTVKNDPNCVYERKLDPQKPKGQKKAFYNLAASLKRLDREYGYDQQTE